MPAVQAEVERRLTEDRVVREALRRKTVDARALARSWIESEGWNVTEEAVEAAISRHAEELEESTSRPARRALEGARLAMRSRVAIVEASKTPEVQRRLSRLFDIGDSRNEDALRVIQSSHAVKIVVDEIHLDEAVEVLGRDQVTKMQKGVLELAVILPAGRGTTARVGSLVLDRLSLQGIDIIEFVSVGQEVVVLIERGDEAQAYRSVSSLVQGPPTCLENGSNGSGGTCGS